MKLRSLILRSALFAVGCYLLLWLCVWVIRFPIPRAIFAIMVSLICLGAEAFAGYFVLRQLWRWSGAVTQRLFKDKDEITAEALLTQRQ